MFSKKAELAMKDAIIVILILILGTIVVSAIVKVVKNAIPT